METLSTTLQYLGIISIPVAPALFAFVRSHVEGRADYWRDRDREIRIEAAIEAALAKAPKPYRPVVLARRPSPPKPQGKRARRRNRKAAR